MNTNAYKNRQSLNNKTESYLEKNKEQIEAERKRFAEITKDVPCIPFRYWMKHESKENEN